MKKRGDLKSWFCDSWLKPGIEMFKPEVLYLPLRFLYVHLTTSFCVDILIVSNQKLQYTNIFKMVLCPLLFVNRNLNSSLGLTSYCGII